MGDGIEEADQTSIAQPAFCAIAIPHWANTRSEDKAFIATAVPCRTSPALVPASLELTRNPEHVDDSHLVAPFILTTIIK